MPNSVYMSRVRCAHAYPLDSSELGSAWTPGFATRNNETNIARKLYVLVGARPTSHSLLEDREALRCNSACFAGPTYFRCYGASDSKARVRGETPCRRWRSEAESVSVESLEVSKSYIKRCSPTCDNEETVKLDIIVLPKVSYFPLSPKKSSKIQPCRRRAESLSSEEQARRVDC